MPILVLLLTMGTLATSALAGPLDTTHADGEGPASADGTISSDDGPNASGGISLPEQDASPDGSSERPDMPEGQADPSK